MSYPSMGPKYPHCQWVWCLFTGKKSGQGVMPNTHLCLVQTLRLSEATALLPVRVFKSWARKSLPLYENMKTVRTLFVYIYRLAHEMSFHWLYTQHIFTITKAFDIWYRINPHRLQNCS